MMRLAEPDLPVSSNATSSEPMQSPQPYPMLEALGIFHDYRGVTALDDVSLSVQEGEFLTILGPSGSGKTTLLRIIGGHEMPTRVDQLRIGGVDVRGLPANHREVATVFQHYALFPHMSVGQNVEYGLKVRGVAPAGCRRWAMEVLALVRLADKYDRRIQQLSGGERQRVAFARALIIEPRILLLDEPMGALDEKLRHEMRVEVRSLQRELGTTFIQVTHSQEEALTMSDRIAVMNRGRIEQLGAPAEIFDLPQTRFVAEFMGTANIVEGCIAALEGELTRIDAEHGPFWGRWSGQEPPVPGRAAFLAVHAQKLRLDGVRRLNAIDGTIRASTYRGAQIDVAIETQLGRLTASVDHVGFADGQAATVSWRAEDCAIGPADRAVP